MTNTTTVLHPWTVWWRPRHGIRWKPILSAATETEAVQEAISRRLGGDWTAQVDGRDPNHRPPAKDTGAALVAAAVRARQAGDTRAVASLRSELERRGVTLGIGGVIEVKGSRTHFSGRENVC